MDVKNTWFSHISGRAVIAGIAGRTGWPWWSGRTVVLRITVALGRLSLGPEEGGKVLFGPAGLAGRRGAVRLGLTLHQHHVRPHVVGQTLQSWRLLAAIIESNNCRKFIEIHVIQV